MSNSKKVPRVATINTVEEIYAARKKWKKICDDNLECELCEYFNCPETCFTGFLAEEIEVNK